MFVLHVAGRHSLLGSQSFLNVGLHISPSIVPYEFVGTKMNQSSLTKLLTPDHGCNNVDETCCSVGKDVANVPVLATKPRWAKGSRLTACAAKSKVK